MNETERRLLVLENLQKTINCIPGYENIKFTLEESKDKNDVVIINVGTYQKIVNIECDSEIAMIVDIMKKF